MIGYMNTLIVKMCRDIFIIAEYFVNKVSPCLCGRIFFGLSEELRYYRDFTESTFSKRVFSEHTDEEERVNTHLFMQYPSKWLE